jgi:hypothetical protein
VDRQKYEILRHASQLAHPGYGSWLYDTWSALNRDCFGSALQVVAIIWGRIGRTCHLSQFEPGMARITLCTSLLSPITNNGDRYCILDQRLAQDTLLHAMMHQAIYERLGHQGSERTGQSAHNNPAWMQEVKRITPLLPHNAKACWILEHHKLDRQTLAGWPYTTRSLNYYSKQVQALI